MVTIEVREPYQAEVDMIRLERAVAVTLQDLPYASKLELTVLLTGDEQLQQLNNAYLGVDAPTDVLAFPAGHIDPDSGATYLGDVLISYPRAQLQAELAGHPVMDEVQLLVVHGVLHLLGHDHSGDPDKTRMWSTQGSILEELGLSTIHPPAE